MQPPQPPRASTLKTGSFIATAVLANSFGNLLLAFGMERIPSFTHSALPHYLLLLVMNPFVLPGTLLTAIYTLAQLSLLSWADLSFVVPLIASSYIVTTLLSEFVQGERVELARWAGVVLIFAGVALISQTQSKTAVNPAEAGPC